MAEEFGLRLELGTRVVCGDGEWGELRDLVLDPDHGRVTHLVVAPHRGPAEPRLIPLDLATRGAAPGEIRLRCSRAEAAGHPKVQDVTTVTPGELPQPDENWDIGVRDVMAVPDIEPGALAGYVPPEPYPNLTMTYDRVPKGMVEIRRESAVTTADGHTAGRIEGFLTRNGEITHIVLERGHLWGRREVSIPVAAIARVSTDCVALTLTKDEVRELPAIRVRRS